MSETPNLTRRHFLLASAATAAATTLPSPVTAQTAQSVLIEETFKRQLAGWLISTGETVNTTKSISVIERLLAQVNIFTADPKMPMGQIANCQVYAAMIEMARYGLSAKRSEIERARYQDTFGLNGTDPLSINPTRYGTAFITAGRLMTGDSRALKGPTISSMLDDVANSMHAHHRFSNDMGNDRQAELDLAERDRYSELARDTKRYFLSLSTASFSIPQQQTGKRIDKPSISDNQSVSPKKPAKPTLQNISTTMRALFKSLSILDRLSANKPPEGPLEALLSRRIDLSLQRTTSVPPIELIPAPSVEMAPLRMDPHNRDTAQLLAKKEI